MPAGGNKQRDAKQDQLRSRKKKFNAAYRLVSMRLKALKNGINGKGDVKFQIPPSDIKEPIPSAVISLLGQLSGQFSQLVGEADSIISEQSGYSRTRRKKKPKVPKQLQVKPVVPTEPDEKIVEQLSRLGISNNTLEAYAGRTFSKLNKYWWQYIKSMFSSDEFNSYRMSLLSSMHDLYYDLLDFENDVLSQPIKNMRAVFNRYQTVRSDLSLIESSIERLISEPESEEEQSEKLDESGEPTQKQRQPKQQQERQYKRPPGRQPAMPVAKINDIDTIVNNVHMLFNANMAKDALIGLNTLIADYKENENPMVKDVIVSTYNNIVSSLAQKVQKKFGPTNDTSVQGIINLVRKNKKADRYNEIVKVAHSRFTRFLRKQIVKRLSFSKAAGHRLKISDEIGFINEDVKDMIKMLEGSLDPETLMESMIPVKERFNEIHKTFGILMKLYEAQYYRGNKKQKGNGKEQVSNNEEFLDELMRRNIRRDLSRDIR